MDKNKKAPARARGEDVSFLLTGKIFCGHCKGTMIGDSGTGKSGNKFYYYSCRTKKTRHTCKKKSVKKEWLEREVVHLTASVVLQDDVIEYIADRVVDIQQKEREDKSIIDYLNNRLSETEAAIRNIMKAIEAGIITETTGARLRELEAEREDLKIEIEKEKIARPVISREQVIYFLERFKGGDVDDKEYQRQIIDMFVNKVFLYDDKIIITYNYSGDNNEITAEIVEEAAEEALSDAVGGCSDKRPSGPPSKNPITTAKNLRLWGFFYPCVPLKMTPVTMFYDNLCHFLCHFLSQKLRFKIPLSDSVAMFLIKLRWIFLLKIILNIIWFYYKIQLVCHIEFFRRKRNKMSEETMWLAYRAQQIQPQAKGMIYGSPGR